MKKIISLLCVLAVTVGILAIGVVSVSADVPTTELELKSGDTVKYSLSLAGVPKKIVGCDFSVYYDSSAFKLNSVADFNDSTNDEDWLATINPDLDGEVRGNWSILKGVDFSSKRNIVTLNLTAKKDCTAHISYFIRYMYDETVFDSADRPQIDQYQITCDVTVNGAAVVKNALPELNVEEEQPNGLFVNSRSGRSDDSDKALSGDSIKSNGGAKDDISAYKDSNYVNRSADSVDVITGNNSGNNSNDAEGKGSGDNKNATDKEKQNASDGAKAQSSTDAKKDGSTESGKSATTGDEVDADNEKATVAPAGGSDEGGSSPVMWIIIAAVVLIAGGLIGYVVVKGKKGSANAEQKTDDEATKPEDQDK